MPFLKQAQRICVTGWNWNNNNHINSSLNFFILLNVGALEEDFSDEPKPVLNTAQQMFKASINDLFATNKPIHLS